MGYRDYATAKAHIVDTNGHGDFTTIQAAITAATSGQTVFVMPGTYTENVTHKAGVNLTCNSGDGKGGQVILLGTLTISGVGTFEVSNIQLSTNSAPALTISGNSATVVNLSEVFIVGTNNTAISYTTSNAAAVVSLLRCTTDMTTTGIALYVSSSTGSLLFYQCDTENSGATATPSSNSAGSIAFFNSVSSMPMSTSGAGNVSGFNTNFNTTSTNTACLTTAGTGGSTFFQCTFNSGSASGASVGSGTQLIFYSGLIGSTNTNAVTGAGTYYSGSVVYSSTVKVNVTTQSYIYFSLVTQTFTATGTYTPTVGMKYCKVRMLGGGGAGGGAPSTTAGQFSAGGGGAGGEYAEGTFSFTTIGASQAVTIAAAATGVSGATGNAGGTCSLGALITAGGGGGGVTIASSTAGSGNGGAGGTGGSGGSFRTPGFIGGLCYFGVAGGSGFGGQGANSQFGSGGAFQTNTTGSAATGYGAGGGGCLNGGSQAARTGGAGVPGIIVIDEYIIG